MRGMYTLFCTDDVAGLRTTRMRQGRRQMYSNACRGVEANFLVQEFVEEAGGADIRVFVIGNKIAGAMKRQAAKGEFRSNLHRGGTASPARLSAAERDIAREAAKVLGLQVAGVDLLQTQDGPKVLEVNS